jgi:hypothetical protein
MNPNQIITPNSHKNVPPAVAEFLRRLKRLRKANSKKVGAILLCALALTGAAKVYAESSASSATSQEDKTYKQEVTLKDGKKISFAELSKLSDDELKLTLAGSDRVERILFKEWRNKEIEKDNARKDAETQRILQDNARLDAELVEIKKEGIKLDIAKCGILRRFVEAKKPINSKYKALVEKYADMNPPNQDALYILKYGIFEKPKP